jgi:glycosyltransferase involved in cell wall biosynthesis
MSLVSVVIPNYNQAQYVLGAVHSVLEQNYNDLEIIVVDDGSIDNSRKLLDGFDNRVRYIWQENQGLAGARNTGIRAAKGEYIGLLDADDEWAPMFLEQMMSLIGRNPEGAVFYCMAQCMDAHGQNLPQKVGGPAIAPENLYWTLLRANFIIPSTVVFRRHTIMEAGLFDASLRSCEDWDLWLRLLPKTEIIGTFESLVRYRVHGSSLSTNVGGMHAAATRVVEKHFGPAQGDPGSWSAAKRRAYGGLYRYQCITLVQREDNWKAGLPLMVGALAVDPSLAMDLDFFYELALGQQPVGYRGAAKVDNFDENAACLESLMQDAAKALPDGSIGKQAQGTSYYALALVSFNAVMRSMFRPYFWKALKYRPDLVFRPELMITYLKSFVSRDNMEKLRKMRRLT